MADSGGTIHQLKITLRHIRPPIWRRVLVPSGATLAHLHVVIQIAVGWDDSHLHEFRLGATTFRAPTPWSHDVSAEEDAGRVLLGDVAPPTGSRFEYTYDFGDSWDHDILVEKILPAEPGATGSGANVLSGAG